MTDIQDVASATVRSRRGAILAAALTALVWAGSPADQALAADRNGPAGCRRADFRVVVDVGHSAEVPGATSARGVPEYEFNLRLAREIERALLASDFSKATLLVTSGPALPSLYRRVAQAHALGAQLFLSIHHDSVPEPFLLVWDHDGSQRRFSDAFRGHSIFISNRNGDVAGSLRFARLLGAQMKGRDLHYTPHYTERLMGSRRRLLVDAQAGVYRYDQLIVLRQTRMPAVLLEAGSIIHRDEELEAASPERVARIAAAVTGAVEEFCASQRVRRAARRARPHIGSSSLPQPLAAIPTVVLPFTP